MNLRAMRFRIGIFVLATLILFGVLVTLFGNFSDLFHRQNEITVIFADAPGVESGTPVRRSGVRIGEVKDLTLDNDTGKVYVRLAVDRRYKLRHNDVPTLVHSVLGGDSAIEFVPKPPTGPQDLAEVQSGDELQGVEQMNVNALVNQAAEVVPTTQEALNQINKALKRLEQLAPATEAAIKEYTELAKDTRVLARELRDTNQQALKLMPEIGNTNKAIQELATETRKAIPDLKRTNDEIQSTARTYNHLGERLDTLLQTNEDKLVKVLDSLNETLQRVSAVLNQENQRNLTKTLRNVAASSDNLESITRNTDNLLRDSQTTIKKLNESMGRADDVLASLQQAIRPIAERSASIAKNLDESAQRLNRALTDVGGLFGTLDQSDGTLRRLLTDPSLYNHLDEAACQIAKLLPRVDRAMKDFEIFADRLDRHPELLGLGGVVHPASGVKETIIGSPIPHTPGH